MEKYKTKLKFQKPFIIIIAILGASIFATYQVARVPLALPRDASPAVFSAARAKQHILAIAQQPHPNGSTEIDEVETYILNELASFGINASVQNATATMFSPFQGSVPIIIKNIVAVIPGTVTQDAVLLSAHYDRKENSPGATDDGIGVATLLETARALQKGTSPKNTIILLFTNPEETGEQGARAFVSNNPLAKDVKVVWNIDAGGLKGPAFMVTTTPANSWLISEISKGVPGIIADGAIQAFSHSSSDFDVIKDIIGVSGAFYNITQDNRIHSAQDNISNFQDGSLQQMGNITLSFARHFGNLDLNEGNNQTDSTYISITGFRIFGYPISVAIPMSLVILVVFGFSIWLGFKNNLVNLKSMGLGLLAAVSGITISVLLVTLLSKVAIALNPAYSFNPGSSLAPVGEIYNEYFVWIAAVLITLFVIFICLILSRRFKDVNVEGCTIGCMIIPCLSVIIISFVKPMASAALVIPMAIQTFALLLWFILYRYREKLWMLFISVLPAMLTIYLFAVPTYIGFIGLKLNQAYFITAFLSIFIFMIALPLNLMLGRKTG